MQVKASWLSGGGGPHPLIVEGLSTGDNNDQCWLMARTLSLSACVDPLTKTRVTIHTTENQNGSCEKTCVCVD